MLHIEFGETQVGVYQILKDFQVFAAALIALGAACIAYISAQRVVRTQSRTARETIERQIAHALSKEDAAQVKRRLAFLVMLNVTQLDVIYLINRRISFLEHFEKATNTRPDGLTLEVKNVPLVWSTIANIKTIREEARLLDINWQELSLVNPVDQSTFHTVRGLTDHCDIALLELSRLGNEHGFVSIVQLQDAMLALNQSKEMIDRIRNQTSAELNVLLPKSAEIANVVRAKVDGAL